MGLTSYKKRARSRANRLLAVAAMLLAAGGVAACGDDSVGGSSVDGGAEELVDHVHGLGVNPADGALMIATHSGLFRSADSAQVDRVGDSLQDTMGFTVVGPNHFLGSGHPGPGQSGPGNLGLIESTDGGRSWRSVSLADEADLHVLRYAHGRIYAINALTGMLMVSEDEGESWNEQAPPPGAIDLAVDPKDPERIVLSTQRGLMVSDDTGGSWRPLAPQVGLLAWVDPEALYLVDAAGEVAVSQDAGERWRPLGAIGGQPTAFAAADGQSLYAARGDGAVVASADGGATWDTGPSE